LKDKYGLEFIPAEIVAEVNELARPSIRYNQRSDARSIAIAKEKVFPAFVESVIEALPIFYDEDTRKVTFMDFLVVCPLNPIFSDLKVYVPSAKAGMLRLPRTNLKNMVLGDFEPDFVLYLDIDPAEGLARARGRGELDRIEQQGLDFFHRTRQRYLELVQNNPKAAIINAGQPLAQVQADIQSAVKNWWVSQAK